MKIAAVLVAFALAGLVSAQDAARFLLKERVSEPAQWIKRGPAPDSHMLDLRFALRQRAVSELETKLLDIADPASTNYGKWMSQDEVNTLVQPAEASTSSVRRWLEENGVRENVEKRSLSGDWLAAEMTVAQARSLLGEAQFHIYEHRSTGEQIVRTTEYSLPRDLTEHIDLVSPTTYFNKIRSLTEQSHGLKFEPLGSDFKPYSTSIQRVSANSAKLGANTPTSCGDQTRVTMQCLRDFYQTADYTVQKPDEQFIGISGFLEEYANYADLKTFEASQRPDAARADYKFTTVELGGSTNDQSDPGVEANLDVQTVAGIGFPIPSTYYSIGGRPPFKADKFTPTNTNEPYSTEFEYLLRQPDHLLPSILSTSYGDDEQTVPIAYQRRVCLEAAALGARGVTLLFAAGDNGVGTDGDCVSNDGKNTRKFLPSFPPSCPYLTAVGGTQGFSPERTVGPSYYGGGGFSETWPAPAYQKTTVDKYVKSLNGKYDGLYNKGGRAYPDLSAQGYAFVIAINGTFGRVSGTSASTPLTAAILGLINDKRLASGKSRLGFINPALYSGAGARGLSDIIVGSNNGCETDGFPATAGWDAATGWGTPNFKKLAAVLG